ncbi:fluoride efflux transporter FluC [Microbacterium sp. PA5]|uniref:fluoride efflux transporter FluC n=1 Tax=Microbacterium sp. PA5 TaxID=3416654 RepID=UPI003CEBD0FA
MALPRWFSPAALVVVVLGGAVGVAARALLVVPLSAGTHPLVVPAVTLGINVAGSLLLGVIVGALDGRRPLLRLFLGTGMMGGFTTYSAFAVHVVTTSSAAPIVGLGLVVLSVFGGVVAATAGLMIGRRISGRPEQPGRPGAAEPPEVAE